MIGIGGNLLVNLGIIRRTDHQRLTLNIRCCIGSHVNLVVGILQQRPQRRLHHQRHHGNVGTGLQQQVGLAQRNFATANQQTAAALQVKVQR